MPRSTYLWLLKCLGLCLLGIPVLSFIGTSVTPLIKWCIYHNDPASPLAKTFGPRFYLPLSVVYGLALGFIPMHRMLEILQSSLGNLFAKPSLKLDNELDWRRPVLWAWVPIGVLFLLRFVAW